MSGAVFNMRKILSIASAVIEHLISIVAIISTSVQFFGYSISAVFFPDFWNDLRNSYSFFPIRILLYSATFFTFVYYPLSVINERFNITNFGFSKNKFIHMVSVGLIFYVANLQLIELFLYGPHPEYLYYYTPEAWGFSSIFIISSFLYILNNRPTCQNLIAPCGKNYYTKSMISMCVFFIGIYIFYPAGIQGN